MGLGDRVHNHRDKIKKDNNDDTFIPIQKPETPEDHKCMTSKVYVIKQGDHGKCKQSNIDYDKQTQGINNLYNKTTETISNKTIVVV